MSEVSADLAMADAEEETPPIKLFTSVRYDLQVRQVTRNREYDFIGWNYRHLSSFYMLVYHRDRLLRAASYWGWDDAVDVLYGTEGLQKLEQILNEAVGLGPQPVETPDDLLEDLPSNLPDPLTDDHKQPKRCKIILDREGNITVELSNVPPETLPCLFLLQFPSPGFMLREGPPIINQPIFDVPWLMRAARTDLEKQPYEVVIDTEPTPATAYTHYKTTHRQMYEAARQRAGIKDSERREVLLVNEDGTIMDGSTSSVYIWRQGFWLTPPVPPVFGEYTGGSGGVDGTTRRWALERRIAEEAQIQVSWLKHGEECWISNGVRGFSWGRIKLH